MNNLNAKRTASGRFRITLSKSDFYRIKSLLLCDYTVTEDPLWEAFCDAAIDVVD